MLTEMKRRTGLLLTLAVVCATVALVPSTAGAASSVNPATGVGADVYVAPTDTTVKSACPGDSAPAAGFTDTTSTDVDCIKMFGITTGKTATTYDPTGTISRQDMARYIHRMFTATGVAAAGAVAVPAFTDMPPGADAVAAINALASHGITTGCTTTTFCPDDNVTREQMALFLHRFAQVAKTDAGAAIATSTDDGEYNFSDIGSTMFEAHEGIIRLFNLGVTDGPCLAGTVTPTISAGTCSTTYRPADNMTRAEMATFLTRLLGHTNARPAGVSIQSTTANLTVGTVSVQISVRNADHSAQANTLVDEFYQVHNDTAGVAAQTPFTAVLGTCSANVSNNAGSTKCSIDANDAATNAYGNIAGTNQTSTAYSTSNWWVHTGASGTAYVDGTTSTYDTYSITFGAASTLVNASALTISQTDAYALTTSKAAHAAITHSAGINTWAGQSRTFSLTLTPATAGATIKDGYSFKVATVTVDDLGNVAMSTNYYTPTNGVATFTTTCPADTGTTVANVDWWTAIQHTVTMGSLTDADGLPTGVSAGGAGDPTNNAGGGANSTTAYTNITNTSHTFGLTCDDTARAYTEASTGESLAISSNNYVSSTAGSLTSVTATAYDQYGQGIAGVETEISSNTHTNAANTTETLRARLTTGANGTASLSAVVCAGAVDKVQWSVADANTAATNEMDAIPTGEAEALTDEGTTTYCVTAGTDGTTVAVTAAREVVVVTFADDLADQDAGSTIWTIPGFAAVTTDSNPSNTELAALLNGLTGVSGMACAQSGGGGSTIMTCTGAVGTGQIGTGDWTVTSTLTDAGAGANATVASIKQDGTGGSTVGADGVTNLFVDDDPTNNFIITNVTTTGDTGTDGASVAETVYTKWLYDSGDVFNLGTDGEIATVVSGASEVQAETEMASLTGESGATPMTISYRTGALTTGISVFQLGT